MFENIAIPLPEALLARMDATPQNPRYHREGSVLAHTRYVLQQFLEHEQSFQLDQDERQALYWAAILHDVGKTVTTIFENGRHRSPGHERAGLAFALEILLQHPEISDANRRRILDLVRWHGLPLKISNWDQPIEVIKTLGTRTNLRLLSIFAYCDFLGRDCDDKADVMARMQQFKDIDAPKAEFELGRFDDLMQASASWNLRHKNATWNAFKIKDMRLLEKLLQPELKTEIETRNQHVTVVFGPAFSGKTTWLDQHFPDQFRVALHEHGMDNALAESEYVLARKLIEFKHLMQVYLNRHKHVVLETRDLNEDIRLRLGQMLRDLPCKLDYVVMEAGLEELKARNLLQETPMSEDKLHAQYHAMDLFHPWEAHSIRYIRG